MYDDALTTNTRVKDRLGITVTDFDELLDRIILAVTARIEQMTNRRFVEATFENELHDGSDPHGSVRKFLVVKNAPVQSITSIEWRAGLNGAPQWTAFYEYQYEPDLTNGLIYFPDGLPCGFQNIRITYTGGFSGHSIGLDNSWEFNVTPTGAVDGVNLTFTLPENAYQIVVYADGSRELASNVTHTDGTSTFTLAASRAPVSAIAVDYRRTASTTPGDNNLPADLVEVCEKAVVRTYKKRESEGRTSETFQESSVNWDKDVFTEEDLRTIRNYRRGYFI